MNLESTEELCLMALKIDAKFEGKLTSASKNIMRNMTKFSPEHSKVSKLGLWWDPLIQSRKCTSLKYTGHLCVMTMKNDAKFEEDLICQFKIDMRDLINFDPST